MDNRNLVIYQLADSIKKGKAKLKFRTAVRHSNEYHKKHIA